ASGFTGAPSITIEAENVAEYWADLGERWSLMIQYFKPYAVCYWAQAAIAGALRIQKEQNLATKDISRIQVYAFHEATRLAMREPKLTDEAQYSLPYPVAAALVYGKLGLPELSGDALHNPEVLRLSNMVELIEDDELNGRFPAERLSRVVMETQDGGRFDTGVVRPLWDLTAQATDEELLGKFRELSHPHLSATDANNLEKALWQIEEMSHVSTLNDMLASISLNCR
ncbi:MAG: MmgE/PrpD family protein, partial [Chloroflexi bacterium]|nr:MmgE/PrpD family protein [Chloroflexota bacterium]